MSEYRDDIDDSEIIEKLKEVDFFKIYADDSEVIRKIVEICTRKKFHIGGAIIEEGEHGDELYIIINGKIDIVKETLQCEKYTVITLDAGKGGIYVGELALIDNDKRSATVIARTDCECIVIKRQRFIKFGDENPEIGLNITRAIARQLSTKLRKTNEDVITLFSALVEEIASDD